LIRQISQVDFKLDGVFEHVVQSEAVFKLRCTKDGQPADVNFPVEAILKGAHDEVRATVTYQSSVYTLSFHARVVGMYEMHVKVNNKWLYKDNDVILSIVEHISKKLVDVSFELDGPVLGGNLKIGRNTQLLVHVKAANGNPRDIDTAELEVRVGQGQTLQKLRVRQVTTGTYETDILVTLPGFYPIDLFFEDRSVLKEPVRVQWTSPSDPNNTKAVQVPTHMVTVGETAAFHIQSRNKNDLNNTSGGDFFEVRCDGPADLPDLQVRDTLNGKYIVSFTPMASGVYEFHISLNGVPIGNSPVDVKAVKR